MVRRSIAGSSEYVSDKIHDYNANPTLLYSYRSARRRLNNTKVVEMNECVKGALCEKY